MDYELAGLMEVGEMLGVSRQRAAQLADSSGFPGPVADLGSGRVWRVQDIRLWSDPPHAKYSSLDASFDKRRPHRPPQGSAKRATSVKCGADILILTFRTSRHRYSPPSWSAPRSGRGSGIGDTPEEELAGLCRDFFHLGDDRVEVMLVGYPLAVEDGFLVTQSAAERLAVL